MSILAGTELFSVIRKCQNGDETACEELFMSFKDYIYRTALVILASREDAEDATQATFIKLFQHLDTYDQARSIKAWVYRMTVNCCMDLLRTKKRQMTLVERVKIFLGDERENEVHSLFDNELTIALQSLSVKLRVVLVLRYLCDMTQEEVASALCIPVGTVKSRLGEGLRRLRTTIEESSNEVRFKGVAKHA